jgi:hypothetical protein
MFVVHLSVLVPYHNCFCFYEVLDSDSYEDVLVRYLGCLSNSVTQGVARLNVKVKITILG